MGFFLAGEGDSQVVLEELLAASTANPIAASRGSLNRRRWRRIRPSQPRLARVIVPQRSLVSDARDSRRMRFARVGVRVMES